MWLLKQSKVDDFGFFSQSQPYTTEISHQVLYPTDRNITLLCIKGNTTYKCKARVFLLINLQKLNSKIENVQAVIHFSFPSGASPILANNDWSFLIWKALSSIMLDNSVHTIAVSRKINQQLCNSGHGFTSSTKIVWCHIW